MSAIVGCWASVAVLSPEQSCRDMLSAQEAYGPDRAELWSAPDLALGRRLFKLLPEDEHDRQPIVGGGGRYRLVADLRLDNRDEILAQLGAPHGTYSDAALLMLVIERYGEDALDLIVGDYAFALWDGQQRSLLLARDPTGQRPLHYHQGIGFFAFSSLPKGLHTLPQLPRRARPERMIEFLAILPRLGPASYYEGVERVEPGNVVTVSAAGLTRRRYWQPKRRSLTLASFEEYRDAFRAELDRAVRSRLRGAGATVATHLSSGWDSNAVTATAALLGSSSGARIHAFTSVPRPGSQSDAPFNRIADEGEIAAQTAAMHSNINHVLVPGSAASPLDALARHSDAFDRPIYALCNLTWLSEIRERASGLGARVLLTGELGNWSISAAPHTILADLVRQGRWLTWWREAWALHRSGSRRMRGIAVASFAPWLPTFAWRAVKGMSVRAEDRDYSAIHPRLAASVERKREELGAGLHWRSSNHFDDTVRAIASYDFGELRKGTLAGWGIDERDPTADRRLIEFCLSIPLDLLLKNGVRRPLARAALSDRLPPAVLDERRKGYQAGDWHEGMTRDRGALLELVEAIAGHDLAASLIDTARLKMLVRNWPERGWDNPVIMAQYRNALLTGLSAGYFIISTGQ